MAGLEEERVSKGTGETVVQRPEITQWTHAILSLPQGATRIGIRDFRRGRNLIEGLINKSGDPELMDSFTNTDIICSVLTQDVSSSRKAPLPAKLPREMTRRDDFIPVSDTLTEQQYALEMKIGLLSELGEKVDSSDVAFLFAHMFLGGNAFFPVMLIDELRKFNQPEENVLWKQEERFLAEMYSFIAQCARADTIDAGTAGNFLTLMENMPMLADLHKEFLIHSELKELSDLLLDIFDALASDDRVYTDQEGKTVRNSDRVRKLLQDDTGMREAVTVALSRSPFNQKLYTGLSQAVLGKDQQSAVEAASMRALQSMDEEGIPLVSLFGIGIPPRTAVRLGKRTTPTEQFEKALFAGLLLPPENRKDPESYLLTAAMRDAARSNPDLLGRYSSEVREVISILDTTTSEEKKPITVSEEQRREITEKINAGAPVIYDFWSTGLGDILLALPAMKELVGELSQRGSRGDIYFVVKPILVPLFQHMLKGQHPRVHIVGVDEGKPGQDDKKDSGRDFEKDFLRSVLGAKRNGNGVPGVLLGYNVEQSTLKEWRDKGVAVQELSYFVGTAATTLVDLREREIEQVLGIKLDDDQKRKIFEQLSSDANTYITQYLSTHQETVRTIEEVRGTEGFENGYITVISNGSHDNKALSPEIMSMAAEHLRSYCVAHNVGVLVLDTDFKGNREDLVEPLRALGIPAVSLRLRGMPLEHSLAIIQGARGTIAPDTFLKHWASLVNPDSPDLTISVDADVGFWQFPQGKTIAAEHPIAQSSRDENDRYGVDAGIALRTIVDPLRQNFTRRERQVHPIFASMQRSFARELRRGFEEFKRQLEETDLLPR